MQRRNFVKLSGVAAALQCLPSIGFSQQGDVFRIGEHLLHPADNKD